MDVRVELVVIPGVQGVTLLLSKQLAILANGILVELVTIVWAKVTGKLKSHAEFRPVKPAALVAPVRGTVNMLSEKAEAITAVRQHTKPVALVSRITFEELLCPPEKSFVKTSEKIHNIDKVDDIDPGY